MARAHIGTSGFHYDHWRGRFYPDDLPKRRWFEHYAQRFDALEVNNTFYGLPDPGTVDAWHDQAPRGFRYALKLSRYATHMKRLRDPERPLALFLERAERLKGFLGPILVQLPPNWRPDLPRLDAFLRAAPRRHRWAVEVRDRRWLNDDLYALLEAHGAALVVHDMIEDHPRVLTADWVYHRFHGQRYQGSYSHQALVAEARRIREHLADGRDAWVFFNNDDRAYAAQNALDLARYLSNGCS